MENQEISCNQGMAKPALTYGLLIGVVLTMVSMGFYLAEAMTNPFASYTAYFVMLVGIVLATLSWRKEFMGGYICYGQALGFGCLTFLFTGLVSGIFSFVFFQFIDPNAVNILMQASEEAMLKSSPQLTDEQLDAALEMQQRFMTPVLISVSAFFSTVLVGCLMSLITSIFLKKKPKEEF
ncbi:MAG TPA: DUF4199 domain-containing protein [Bacteroidales bacterium]|nr:DUF4199 domain-containing protein [Bacteroidales bacterium]